MVILLLIMVLSIFSILYSIFNIYTLHCTLHTPPVVRTVVDCRWFMFIVEDKKIVFNVQMSEICGRELIPYSLTLLICRKDCNDPSCWLQSTPVDFSRFQRYNTCIRVLGDKLHQYFTLWFNFESVNRFDVWQTHSIKLFFHRVSNWDICVMKTNVYSLLKCTKMKALKFKVGNEQSNVLAKFVFVCVRCGLPYDSTECDLTNRSTKWWSFFLSSLFLPKFSTFSLFIHSLLSIFHLHYGAKRSLHAFEAEWMAKISAHWSINIIEATLYPITMRTKSFSME